MWIAWIIIAVILIIAELMSQILWAFCLAVGAIGAMIAALCGASVVWQIIIMAIFGVLFYLICLPLFRRYLNSKGEHAARTGMDALLGRHGVVTKEIQPGKMGRVRIDGDNWQAIAPGTTETIHAGEETVVEAYDSIILTVKPVKS